MLTIRLARIGKRNSAQFKIMLQERTIAPGGRHIEILGSYNPHSKETILKEDRIKYWVEKGAFVSDTVHNLLVKKGVISEKKRIVKLPKKVKKAEKVENAVAESEEVAAEKIEKAPKEEEKKVAEVTEKVPVSDEVTTNGEEAKPVEETKAAETPKQE